MAVVQRKPFAGAVTEFHEGRKVQTVAPPGKRPALNPVYVQDTERQLNEFAGTFPETTVADLAKTHIDAYIGAHGKLSPKSRNHLRATVRMFLGWCVRRDYLPANSRFIQRFWRSVKQEDIYLQDYSDGLTAQRGLARWFGDYNTRRPHQALGYATPGELYHSPESCGAKSAAWHW